ncbi:ATP-grasp domain-containing protein [Virgibacillus sp. W0181]|uniref:ATP-grasp domain-containing protein n=1 Tax=Virgibacillus sp. W0181 TaxID=3391581 RepID=UPI003F469A69
MKLYEYEGKQLFKKYGIPIADGWLVSHMPHSIDKPVVLKAQVLAGGRGKQGGIMVVNELNDLQSGIESVERAKINNEKVTDVYVEEKVDYTEEYYLSLIVDRNTRTPVLIACKEGGVDIESVPQGKILKVVINPLIGLKPYMVKRVASFLQLKSTDIEDIIFSLWELFVDQQAELVEVNPLFQLHNKELLAGDSKIVLDNDRRQRLDIDLLPRSNQTLEDNIQELGAVGVKMEGDLAIITSGAGLGLATMDLVKHNHQSVCALIDLGGHVIYDVDAARNLIRELKKLNPKMFVFNFYFQVASCYTLAQAISEELGDLKCPVVVRLKGVDEEKAQKVLQDYSNIYTTETLLNLFTKINQGV